MDIAELKELPTTRPLDQIIQEVIAAVQKERTRGVPIDEKIKDLRWEFDQVSAKMNQAIYNNQTDMIHKTCLETIAVLIEMLARS
jgi:uncharacterized coiled-coil DUF342 family protein